MTILINASRRHAFTLIELLIVIAIILILISIALPNFLEAQLRAKVARAAGDIKSISFAIESYNLDRKTYPDDCITGSLGCMQITTPIRYIGQIPQDPFGRHKNSGGSWEGLAGENRAYYPVGTGVNPETATARKYKSGQIASPPYREVYIIYSSGPSQREPGGSTEPFPTYGGTWTIYSPTNGTMSYGGIIRTGGARLTHPDLANLRVTR